VEDKISGLEDRIDIKEKTEEFLNKRLKCCERNMQEFCGSIKRPNCESWASRRRRDASKRYM
jgi:hypothetical protein